MDTMNLIQDICLLKININNTPKKNFIIRSKQIKKFNNKISEFFNLDIFSASNSILSFLLSLDKEITKNINGYLWYDDMCISIKIYDDNHVLTNVDYYPNSNRFEIRNEYMSYSIYRNTKISNRINKTWEPLTDKIKKRYIDIIIEMIKYIN